MTLESLREFISMHAEHIPFLMSAASGGVRETKISPQRMIEAAVTAIVLAGVGYVIIIPKLEERIGQQSTFTMLQISELKESIRSNELQRQQDYRDLSAQIRKAK